MRRGGSSCRQPFREFLHRCPHVSELEVHDARQGNSSPVANERVNLRKLHKLEVSRETFCGQDLLVLDGPEDRRGSVLRVYAYFPREEPRAHVEERLDPTRTPKRARYARDGRTMPPSSGLERG